MRMFGSVVSQYFKHRRAITKSQETVEKYSYITKKEVTNMSNREKEIIETFAEAIPNMSDYEKGYFMGRAEGMLQEKKKRNAQLEESE